MFALRNPIEDYTSVPLTMTQLPVDEQPQFSFRFVAAKRQWMGYTLDLQQQFIAHFTDRRLILEPYSHPDATTSTSGGISTSSVRDIPYTAITAFKLIHIPGLFAYCQMILQPEVADFTDGVWAVATVASASKPNFNRAADAVTLGNLMLKTDERLMRDIQTSQVPVLVNFWLQDCEPCQMFAPILDQVLEQWGDQLKLVQINMDEEFSLPMRYGVNNAPTVLLIQDGKVIDRVVGAMPASLFAKVLQQHFG